MVSFQNAPANARWSRGLASPTVLAQVAEGEIAATARVVVPREAGLLGTLRIAGEVIALIYIGLIAFVASVTGAFYVLFPELGALSHDVFTRPRGALAKAPILLAITPVLTGVVGILVTRELP